MATLSVNHSFIKQSNTAALLIGGARSLYLGLKNLLDMVGIFFLFLLFGLPVICFLYFIIYYIRIQLSKDLVREVIINTSEDYLALRHSYDKLCDSLSKMGLLSETQKDDAPFIIRGLVNQIFKVQKILLAQKEIMKQALKDLEAKVDNNSSSNWSTILEDELWKGRNKHYQYLI